MAIMINFDDSDMKIVGETSGLNAVASGDDTADTAQLLEREKENGNLNRARRLGALLAEEVAAADSPPNPEATNRHILMAFIVDVALDNLLPNMLLAQAAQNVFNDTLRAVAANFFNEMQESGAFSFYYLIVRDTRTLKAQRDWDGEAVAGKVGETYARLCGRADDPDKTREGSEIYLQFIDRVRNFISQMNFQSDY